MVKSAIDNATKHVAIHKITGLVSWRKPAHICLGIVICSTLPTNITTTTSSKDVMKAYKYPLRKFKDNSGPLALARMVPNNMNHPSVPLEKEIEEFLQQYNGPAQIVWGMNDPVMWKLRRRTSRLLPQAKVVKTEAGHFVQEETPEKVIESIKEIFKLRSDTKKL